jgi:hypothetical protein
MPDDPATIAILDAAADDLAVVREPEAAVADDEVDVVEVVRVADPVVTDPVAVAVPVPPVLAAPPRLVLLPPGAAAAGTCAAAGAASRRLNSKARRAGSVMAVTRALPLPNATGTRRFPDTAIGSGGAAGRPPPFPSGEPQIMNFFAQRQNSGTYLTWTP